MQELLDRARAGHVLDALGMLTALSVHTEPLLRDALIQQARRGGATSSQMAARIGVSTTVFARRYTVSAVSRRLASPRPAEIYRAAREISLPARQGALPTDPALLLAQALGGLVEQAQRGKPGDRFRTRQDVAAEAGVHPSYLSRIVMGKRRPSWATTYRLTVVCKGDVSAIRSLWEAAAYSDSTQEAVSASVAAQRPSTLQDLLLGLFLAAGQPNEWDIANKGGGEVKDIQAILEGRFVGWEAVSKFSTALGLDPSAAYPLWALAQSSEPPPAEGDLPAATDRKS
ncbi:helix-turn-helix domain-containing protein [Streptomyces sp. NPDC085942]|uniref:helix-turn-helix domain-containing protein n=1 Tax=Streptomyces sp. NPDC085942 TaxID=3365743 RepID=UPI0037D199DB